MGIDKENPNMQIFTKPTTELNISELVEQYVLDNGGSYIDAVLCVCEKEYVDPIIAAKYLKKPIKEKIEIEGVKLNILPSKKGQ